MSRRVGCRDIPRDVLSPSHCCGCSGRSLDLRDPLLQPLPYGRESGHPPGRQGLVPARLWRADADTHWPARGLGSDSQQLWSLGTCCRHCSPVGARGQGGGCSSLEELRVQRGKQTSRQASGQRGTSREQAGLQLLVGGPCSHPESATCQLSDFRPECIPSEPPSGPLVIFEMDVVM